MDENRLTPEQLFRITFNLCHVYPPTTKSISIPTPVQYAHLAAKRARSHVISSAESQFLKRKIHPRNMKELTDKLNREIRACDRGSHAPINMYFI